MAQPSNTFDTYDAVGIREDLADVIYNISPTETPFMTNAAKGTATNSLHEWQTDGLRAAANNFQIEGDDYGGSAIIPTDRLNNRTQISAEAIIISGTDRSVDNAGRGDELAYALAKIGKSIKRDMEVGMVGVEQAKATGKPQEIAEKMVEGRMKKYYQEVVLLEQTSVIDGETRIADVIANAAREAGVDIALKAFVRFNLGEGVEKEESDFASEVAAQLA